MNLMNQPESLAALAGPKCLYVDSSALEHNAREVKKALGPLVKLLAVVKGDGYGVGGVEAARIFASAGADYLGVSSVQEGVELRKAGIRAPVLVMNPILREECVAAIEHDLEITVASRQGVFDVADASRRVGRTARIHLEIETGLGRTGLPAGEVPAILDELRSCEGVHLCGIFTHMGEGHRDESSFRQFARFQAALRHVPRGLVRHVSNSAAFLKFPDMRLDMVRIGTLLYGQLPFGIRHTTLSLKNVWDFRARVLFIHDVGPGDTIGYGGDYLVKRPMKIAVVSAGYSDGFGLTAVSRPKDLSDLARYIVKMVLSYLGKGRGEGGAVRFECGVAPVVGRIGMQLTMVDVTGLPVSVGDEASVSIRPTAGARLPRVYLRDGVPYLIRMPWGEMRPVEFGKSAGYTGREVQK
ncbi:MAG: alanine racemase [Firmicutes bacterium]|nr:alanine racemase [Candidatus Fermentithermobacillaceae bacterium]